MIRNMKKSLAYIVAIAALCACTNSQTAQQQAAAVPEQVTPKVSVVAATHQKVEHGDVYSSTVLANVTNNIAPQTGGRIQRILVDVGDFVKAGQVLAEMDRVQLDQASLNLANSETELSRLKELYAQGGVSKSDFEAAELAVKVARSSYSNLLENTVLRAPVAGVVTARNYDRGDMYGMTSPIFTVQQITPVKLLVAVSESDYAKVHKGDEVNITVDALPGRNFSGKVNKVYPTIDPVTHTVNVEVIVPNSDRALRPGMFAKVAVIFETVYSIVIPDSAIVKQQGSGQRMVYVLKDDGTVALRAVQLGRHMGGEYEILSGVEAGENVVVKGQTALRSGVKVEVI